MIKAELERLNYYSWARFLEQINDDNALIRVIDKLELSTPRRENLSVYREILRRGHLFLLWKEITEERACRSFYSMVIC